jgi:hypothetical protein
LRKNSDPSRGLSGLDFQLYGTQVASRWQELLESVLQPNRPWIHGNI